MIEFLNQWANLQDIHNQAHCVVMEMKYL